MQVLLSFIRRQTVTKGYGYLLRIFLLLSKIINNYKYKIQIYAKKL